MKILMLSWEFPPCVTGGLGRHVAELAPALANEGVEVHVMAPHPSPPLPTQKWQNNLSIHWVDSAAVDAQADIYTRASQIGDLMTVAANALWSEAGGFDLIHVHDWLVAFAGIALKTAHNRPLIATIHATEQGRWRNQPLPDDLSRRIDSVEKELSRQACCMIACSHYMVGELIEQFSLSPDELDMIPNGINLAKRPRHFAYHLAEFKAKYVSPEQPLIFSVGRLVYEKGFHVLIGAMPKILAEYPHAKLLIAGKGPLRDYLQNIVHHLRIEQRVHFAGFISDEERDMLFAAANCAVFPSLYEPFGIVALEAMAHNCPVVVSKVGGFAEVVTHKETGTIVYPDNSDSTAWGVLEVLNKPQASAEYVANAHQMIVRQYSWQHIARQTKALYEQKIGRWASGQVSR
ncbi:MAG TPA: glycosyltransferase family 4 protein [Chloroflexi bacterium]|nr:glycosyltransferase family 4 protein [Chloroflexota bacterium]